MVAVSTGGQLFCLPDHRITGPRVHRSTGPRVHGFTGSTGPPAHGSTGSNQKESGWAASFSQVSNQYCISPPTGHGPPKIQRGCLRPYFPSSGSTIVPLRTGPPYRWNPRGLHVPTVGLQPPTLASILSTFRQQEPQEPQRPEPHQNRAKNTDINIRARTLLQTLVVGPALAAPLDYVVRVACSYEDTGSYTGRG